MTKENFAPKDLPVSPEEMKIKNDILEGTFGLPPRTLHFIKFCAAINGGTNLYPRVF
jgi:hypothetical protein